MRYAGLLTLFVITVFGYASGQNVPRQSNNSVAESALDGGIYVAKPNGPLRPLKGTPEAALGLNQCFDIVSYNFSSGNSPKLQNVTTCTPGTTVTTRKIRGNPATPTDNVFSVSDKK